MGRPFADDPAASLRRHGPPRPDPAAGPQTHPTGAAGLQAGAVRHRRRGDRPRNTGSGPAGLRRPCFAAVGEQPPDRAAGTGQAVRLLETVADRKRPEGTPAADGKGGEPELAGGSGSGRSAGGGAAGEPAAESWVSGAAVRKRGAASLYRPVACDCGGGAVVFGGAARPAAARLPEYVRFPAGGLPFPRIVAGRTAGLRRRNHGERTARKPLSGGAVARRGVPALGQGDQFIVRAAGADPAGESRQARQTGIFGPGRSPHRRKDAPAGARRRGRKRLLFRRS